MTFNPSRSVSLRLWHELRNHPGPGGDHRAHPGGGFGGGRNGGGGGRRPHPPGPDPRPDRPPDTKPHDQDGADGPFRVVRPADMLVVDIGLVNLRFDGRRLVRRDPGAPTLILVGLPPQHVLEEVPRR